MFSGFCIDKLSFILGLRPTLSGCGSSAVPEDAFVAHKKNSCFNRDNVLAGPAVSLKDRRHEARHQQLRNVCRRGKHQQGGELGRSYCVMIYGHLEECSFDA